MGLDLGQMLVMVFVDLKKVFGPVDDRIFCNKLKLYGIQQKGLSWSKCYLPNRTKYCTVGGYDSSMGELEVGVPQGLCFGPLLFLIYINDLPKTTQGKLFMYDDDTNMCHMSNDISKLEFAVNEDLEPLDNWLKASKLSLNVATTKSMLICTTSRRKILNSNDDKLHLLTRYREIESVDVSNILVYMLITA